MQATGYLAEQVPAAPSITSGPNHTSWSAPAQAGSDTVPDPVPALSLKADVSAGDTLAQKPGGPVGAKSQSDLAAPTIRAGAIPRPALTSQSPDGPAATAAARGDGATGAGIEMASSQLIGALAPVAATSSGPARASLSAAAADTGVANSLPVGQAAPDVTVPAGPDPAAQAGAAGILPITKTADKTGFAALFANAAPRTSAPIDAATTQSDAPTGSAPSSSAAAPGTGSTWLSVTGGLPLTAPSAPSGSVSFSIGTPVGEPGFGQDLARGMVYLARSGSQSAQLTLDPAHLGPVRVEVQMNGQQASLIISASQEATRTAMHESLPQLHALFEQSGLRLTGAQIGDGSQANSGGQSGHRPDRSSASASNLATGPGTGDAPASDAIALPASRRIGLVDTFA